MKKIEKTNKSIATIVTILIILFIMIITSILNARNSCTSFNCLVFPEMNLWKVGDVYKSDKTSWEGLVNHPKYQIRINKVSGASLNDSEEFSKIVTMNIKGLFDTARSPYAGEISDKITCPENLIPKEEEFDSKFGTKIKYISTYLNDRLQYGACTENQIRYRSYVGMFYCSEIKEWYKLELIAPNTSDLDSSYFRSLFLEAGCQRPSINTGRLLP